MPGVRFITGVFLSEHVDMGDSPILGDFGHMTTDIYDPGV
jgi:hypothetical protein